MKVMDLRGQEGEDEDVPEIDGLSDSRWHDLTEIAKECWPPRLSGGAVRMAVVIARSDDRRGASV